MQRRQKANCPKSWRNLYQRLGRRVMRWRRRLMAFNPVSWLFAAGETTSKSVHYLLLTDDRNPCEMHCFLVQWCNNAGNGRVVLAHLVRCRLSWIIDALRPGSPMISDHLQHKMRSSTIWGQLKGQHLNQLQRSGWVKISKLAVLLSLNVINAIKQYCTGANWSGHKMRWSVDQIKTRHHNKDTHNWFRSGLICPTFTYSWFWI